MTENYRSGLVPALLALALVLSLVINTSPASAGGVTSHPGGTTIFVAPGDVFLLRHELYFDDTAEGGYFTMTITWHSPSSDENFTLENKPSVYWSDGTPVENVVSCDENFLIGGITSGWRVVVKIPAENKVWVDGHFNIDVWLRACSGDGTPHREDNQWISYGIGIVVAENTSVITPVAPVTVRVIGRGVDVLISPDNQSGLPGENLRYTVTVRNTGLLGDDNYVLTVRDNAVWGDNVTLDNYRFKNIPENENRTTTLHVHIPEDASGEDNITVTATSQGDNTKSDNVSCIAHVKMRGVDVLISPSDNDGLASENVTFTVTVTNTGGLDDNYSLTAVPDNADWPINIELERLTLAAGASDSAILTVSVPSTVEGGDNTTITVTATSQGDNTKSDNASCIAHVTVVRGVQVTILPDYDNGMPCTTLDYTVTVRNTGNIDDNYNLSWIDNAGWDNIWLGDNLLWVARDNENSTTLHVHIPGNATPCTEDNTIVIATLQDNDMVSDNDSCIAHATITRGVRVSISPSENSAFPGENVAFTVTITNTGDNVDNYSLDARDDLGWTLSLADNLLGNVMLGENRTTTLTVTIPENAEPGAEDNITVTAASKGDPSVRDNGNCVVRSIAIIRGVEVSISPAEKEGMPEVELSYTVEVANTGNIVDVYNLTVSDNADPSWGPSLSENTLEVPAGENGTTTLSVTVPENTMLDTEDEITIVVTSRENGAITALASCVGRSLILRRVEVKISPGYRDGPPGSTLYYTVTVANTGQAADIYNLHVTASTGWFPDIEPSSLTLDPGESDNATLSVVIPSNVSDGDTGIMEVRAISTTDPSIQGDDTCRAVVGEVEGEGVGLSVPWLQIILVAALIAGVVFVIGYLTSRRGRGSRRTVLKDVSA